MNIQYALCLALMCLTASAFAFDDPKVDEGASQYNSQMCISNYTQNCITNVCANSEDIDCESKCSADARDKCAQQTNE